MNAETGDCKYTNRVSKCVNIFAYGIPSEIGHLCEHILITMYFIEGHSKMIRRVQRVVKHIRSSECDEIDNKRHNINK